MTDTRHMRSGISSINTEHQDLLRCILLRERARIHIAPCFLCVVSPAMLPSRLCDSHMMFSRSFSDCHLSKCVGEAKLEGPSGWLWHATFQVRKDTLVLAGSGWATFAHDQRLEEGDMLLFTYIGRNSFKIRVFGQEEGFVEKGKDSMPSTTKLLTYGDVIIYHRNDEEGDQEASIALQTIDTSFQDPSYSDNYHGDGVSQRTKAHLLCDTNAFHDDISKKEQDESTTKRRSAGPTTNIDQSTETMYKHEFGHPNNVGASNEDCSISEVEEERGASIGCSKGHVPNAHIRGDGELRNEISTENEGEQGFNYVSSLTMGSKFLMSFDKEGEHPREESAKRAKIFHESIACNLSNPTVTKSMTISAVCGDFKLVFPMAFVRMHMPNNNAWITFVDASQKKWPCRWLGDTETRERLCVYGGWQPFVKAHALAPNDVCIFELIDRKALCFNVHIFKV